MPERYQVQPGDCISSIAFEHGFFWKTLWRHAENSELKSLRKNPNILKEGDEVVIPDLEAKIESRPTEQRHRFRLKGAPAKLRLRIVEPGAPATAKQNRDESPAAADGPGSKHPAGNGVPPASAPPPKPLPKDEPCAGLAYMLDVGGAIRHGKTNANGVIECRIPPNRREGKLILAPGTPDEVVMHLKIGHLDPVENNDGVQARLNNLGFRCGPMAGALSPESKRTLKAFQAKSGLPESGELDAATRNKLQELHDVDTM
jgi:hypothetical protein